MVHYGLPSDIESYVQEIGRAGRDNTDSEGLLCYYSFNLAHCKDDDVRTYVKNKNQCRRQLLLDIFKEKSEPYKTLHKCCDICEVNCACEYCKLRQNEMQTTDEPPKPIRYVTDEQKAVFKACLQSRNGKIRINRVFDVTETLTLNNIQINILFCDCINLIATKKYIYINFFRERVL